MFYLTTHSTHFIDGYMASDIWLRTILIVRKETRCRNIGYSYRLTARVLLYAPSHRQGSTYHGLCYTSRGALAGTTNSSMGLKLYTLDITYLHTLLRAFAYGGMDRLTILRDEHIELFLVPASAPRLMKQRPWYVWDGAYKRTLPANRKRVAHVAAVGFLSRYLSGPLPYVRRHIIYYSFILPLYYYYYLLLFFFSGAGGGGWGGWWCIYILYNKCISRIKKVGLMDLCTFSSRIPE